MNKRDVQIASINSSVDGLRKDRLKECRENILKGYSTSSMVERFAHVVGLTDREPSDFRVLTNSEARPLAQFNGESFVWDMYCKGLGRSIALAEERFLLEALAKITGDGDPVDARNPSMDPIINGIHQLRSKGGNPTLLIAPISLYTAVFKGLDIDLQTGEHIVLPDKSRLEVLWAGASTPIDRFVVLDPSAGEWHVKIDPEANTRLTIAIGRKLAPFGGVTFLAETVVKYEITNRERIYIIEVEGEPAPELGL